uniref:Troponin C skeletal muscle n=1 Tax=Rhizophora mucronata TaxID=61149 RepID=A0A2P2LYC0_RHIMU
MGMKFNEFIVLLCLVFLLKDDPAALHAVSASEYLLLHITDFNLTLRALSLHIKYIAQLYLTCVQAVPLVVCFVSASRELWFLCPRVLFLIFSDVSNTKGIPFQRIYENCDAKGIF